MHAKDLIYMAYFDPHRVFDGLTSYIHSMRAAAPTHLLCRPCYAAPMGGGAVNMHDRRQQRGLCMLLNHSLHMPTRYNGGSRPLVHGGGCGCPVIPLVESQL
jgi:hypothetical protein